MTGDAPWPRPPAVPVLGVGEVAVWCLPRDAPLPLETVAARYAGVRPDAVTVTRSTTGKPSVDGTLVAFSLAHSGDVALVAAGRAPEVGVDVEVHRDGVDGWALVGHAFTEAERTRLEALPAPQRSEAVLAAWTRKEALLKAVGTGLGLDPRLIELDGGAVVSAPPELGEPDEWTIVDLPLPGYAAAVAQRGEVAGLQLYRIE